MPDNSALLIWEKLRPIPSSNDIAEALRCEIHDPLWLLARQWQLGEFKAEDAGMAAFTHVVTTSTPLQRFMGSGQNAASTYKAEEKPINAQTEQLAPSFDLSLRLEAGRMWQKMLINANKGQAWEVFRQNPLLQFKAPSLTYESGSSELSAYSYEPYSQIVVALSNGRMVDGALLYKELQTRKASDFLPQADSVVNETGSKWVQWVNNRIGIAGPQTNTCWDAGRLEYRATISAILPDNTAATLHMPEYNGQNMDSFSWEQAIAQQTLSDGLDASQITIHRNTFIPTPVSFPSMPRARWWEFEDSTLDLSNLQARKTDLGLLLLSEFSLLYSNDWLLTPLTLPVGHLAQVRSMRVTDVFGVQSYINPVPQNENWELFQITSPAVPTPKGWLYLPPVTNHFLQSDTLEEIHFIRDEMANLVWGVEMVVPNGLGEGMDGQSAALRLESWLEKLAGNTTSTPMPDISAPFTYQIGSTVPPHWIPFIPIRPNAANEQIVFRRANMPRFVGDFAPTRIRPRTDILRSVTDEKRHYDIQEEEIPTTGITVKQAWRRARWFDGRTITWLSREKSIGRHLQSSGLQFDQAE
ncbi:hypothetical protein GXP67_22090 [Rhodocytophaga rosea]|uniref:Uncharacterized protein n=1 Tax=Rhodocytophaga rosea TaxID=2704465 RepID=A0A6C0GM97_9BACT|nr:hypothetical protein [Rhodocytophaga rosea]QHT69139.1 hypothetical protein GXP67_22090 [Rhodocytophaga rosea]